MHKILYWENKHTNIVKKSSAFFVGRIVLQMQYSKSAYQLGNPQPGSFVQ